MGVRMGFLSWAGVPIGFCGLGWHGVLCDKLVEQQGIFWLTCGAGTRVIGDLSRITGELSCAWPGPDGITISRLVSRFPPCASLPPLLSWSYVSPGSPGC